MHTPLRRKNMFGAFMAMLASVGGSFDRTVQNVIGPTVQNVIGPTVQNVIGPKTPREKRYGRPEVRWMRPLRDEHYYMDGHGTIHRRQPKRDKGISARQWKKTRNRSGRSVVAMAASAELLEARKLSSEEICLKFRVPLHQVGLASPPA
jgi:hypothetical protein